MDAGAAARLRKLLKTQKTANLPLYLHSPGGDVRQGIAMGRLLREHKATARVGRTMVKECGADGQADAACLKLKQSGRELEAELIEASAFCNSSCTYMLFGATRREIAPEVTVGVHSARVTINYSGGRSPPKAVRDQAASRAMERLDRDLLQYVGAMGVDRALLDLIKTVKFEQMHALKRDELIRFAIDKREFVETSWRFTDRGERSYFDKVAQERDLKESERVSNAALAVWLHCSAQYASRLLQEQRRRKPRQRGGQVRCGSEDRAGCDQDRDRWRSARRASR